MPSTRTLKGGWMFLFHTGRGWVSERARRVAGAPEPVKSYHQGWSSELPPRSPAPCAPSEKWRHLNRSFTVHDSASQLFTPQISRGGKRSLRHVPSGRQALFVHLCPSLSHPSPLPSLVNLLAKGYWGRTIGPVMWSPITVINVHSFLSRVCRSSENDSWSLVNIAKFFFTLTVGFTNRSAES